MTDDVRAVGRFEGTNAHASAPLGSTPTARSCTTPTGIPAFRAVRWAAASCSAQSSCTQAWKATREASSPRAAATEGAAG